MRRAIVAVAGVLVTCSACLAGFVTEFANSFNEHPEFVKPFVTVLGTLGNAGWYQSAKVGREFGFYVGMPISVVFLGNRDLAYDAEYIDDGCRICNETAEAMGGSVNCRECQECREFTTPTIFGQSKGAIVQMATLDQFGNVLTYEEMRFHGGLLKPVPMPFATLQTSVSMFHTELKFRYIGAKVQGYGVRFLGAGVQHDLASFLPEIPVSLSLAMNYTLPILSWEPEESSSTGMLKLNGVSCFVGVLAGYRMSKFETFLEAGWEYSMLKTGGDLVIEGEPFEPGTMIVGRNAFRVGLNLSFLLGYNPVIGGMGGAQWGSTANIFGYKFERE